MQFDSLSRGTRLFAAASVLFGSSESERILDAIPARIAIVDSAGNLRSVNAAWRALGEAYPQPFDRRSSYLKLWDAVGGINERAAWAMASGLRAVLDGSSPSFETNCILTTGEGERRAFKCMIAPMGEGTTGSRGAVVMHIDIDLPAGEPASVPAGERPNALAADKARGLAFAADAAPALVGYVDADLRYRAANRHHQEWFGIPAADMIGMRLADVAGQGLFRRVEGHLRTALAGEPVTFDDTFDDRPGAPRWFRANLIPDTGKDGRVRGVCLLAYDISAAKEDESRLLHLRHALEQAGRSQSTVIERIAQEFKSPLDTIVGFSETLASELFGPISEQYREYSRDIRDIACGMNDLVADLVDLARFQSGQLELAEERIDLAAMLGAGLGRAEAEAREAGVTLKVQVPRAMPGLFADERLVRQVLHSLVANGVRFCADGGRIAVTARRQKDGSVAVVVTDDDLRMEPADLDRLLEPFARLDLPRADGIGTLLALPLARNYMALHGGSLTLSVNPKGGVSASAVFPRARVVG